MTRWGGRHLHRHLGGRQPGLPQPARDLHAGVGPTFAIGTATVDCSATDASGNVATGSFRVEVVDILPPVLTLPADITVNATVPEGAVAPFVATAVDDDRRIPTPPVTCTPAPGSMIAIGDTTVTCTAIDLYGNIATGSFIIHVKGAAEQLADFVAASQGVGPGNRWPPRWTRPCPTSPPARSTRRARASTTPSSRSTCTHPRRSIPTVAVALIADATRIKNVMACV